MFYFLILIICVSLDIFIVMMEEGATCLNIDLKTSLSHGLIFGLVNSLALLAGNLIGNIFNTPFFVSFNRILCCFILVIISLIIAIKISGRNDFVEKLNLNFGYNTTLRNAFLTSIDIFLVGLTVPSLSFTLIYQWTVAFVVTFLVAMIALSVGYHRGAGYQKFLGYSCSVVYLVLAFGQLIQFI